MAPISYLKKATENLRATKGKVKATVKNAKSTFDKTVSKAAGVSKKTPAKARSTKAVSTPKPEMEKVVSEVDETSDYEEEAASDSDGTVAEEEALTQKKPSMKAKGKSKAAANEEDSDFDDEADSYADDKGVLKDQDTTNEPNIYVRDLVTRRVSKVYRNPINFDKTLFWRNSDYHKHTNEVEKEIKNATRHADNLLKSQAASAQKAANRKVAETQAEKATRLGKDERDTWEAESRLEMAYLAETFTTFEFHKEAQDKGLAPFELEHQKRTEILGYRGNSEYYHDMKENSGFSATVDILQSATNPQIFLDERPDVVPTAQEIADVAKLVEEEDAEDYVEDWRDAYNISIQLRATRAGFVAAPAYCTLETACALYRTAYGLENTTEALQACFDWAEDDLTMIINGYSDGTLSIAVYGAIVDQAESDTESGDGMSEPIDEGYGTASNRDSREASDSEEIILVKPAASTSIPNTATQDVKAKGHTTEVVRGREAVFAKLLALNWNDENQVMTTAQRHHGSHAVAFLLGKAEGCMRFSPIDATMALENTTMSVQALIKNQARDDVVLQGLYGSLVPIYEELLSYQGLIALHEENPVYFDAARAAMLRHEAWVNSLPGIGKGGKSTASKKANKPKPMANNKNNKRKAKDLHEESDSDARIAQMTDVEEQSNDGSEPRAAKKRRVTEDEDKSKRGRGRPSKPAAEKKQPAAKGPARRAPRKSAAAKAAEAVAATGEFGGAVEQEADHVAEQGTEGSETAEEPRTQTTAIKRKRAAATADDDEAEYEDARAKKPRATQPRKPAAPKTKAAPKPKRKTKKQIAAEAKAELEKAVAQANARVAASAVDLDSMTVEELKARATGQEPGAKGKGKANAAEDVAADDLGLDEHRYRQKMGAFAVADEMNEGEESEEE